MARFAEHNALKDRIRAGEPVVGVFVKTPAVQAVEIVAGSGVDFVALDAEHAPFDFSAVDRCILAGHASGTPVLVRVPSAESEMILQVLDLGAAGIIVPHICSAEDAERAVAATRYRGGRRGFSPSGRSGGYGVMPAADYRAASDDAVIVIGQIEDAEAVPQVAEITTIDSIDALLIGRADLSVSLGVDAIADPAVGEAVETICAAASAGGRPSGMFLPNAQDVPAFRRKGVSFFIIGTDQSLLKGAARTMTDAFKSALD